MAGTITKKKSGKKGRGGEERLAIFVASLSRNFFSDVQCKFANYEERARDDTRKKNLRDPTHRAGVGECARARRADSAIKYSQGGSGGIFDVTNENCTRTRTRTRTRRLFSV